MEVFDTQMKEYIDEEQNSEPLLAENFEEEFNATFSKLEVMQEKIVEAKIAELERTLDELEVTAVEIITKVKGM